MKSKTTNLAGSIAIAAVLLPAGLTSLPGFFVAPAEAVVGRPLTPASMAGVARRTTRRTVYGTAAVTSTAVASSNAAAADSAAYQQQAAQAQMDAAHIRIACTDGIDHPGRGIRASVVHEQDLAI